MGTPEQVGINKAVAKAAAWRKSNGYVGRAGVVVLFDGEVQGWVSELRNPDHWQVGCIAVSEDGKTWTATGDNTRDSARAWSAN